MSETILYGETPQGIYIRAKGHLTAKLCADVRTRAFERIESGDAVPACYLDLSECEYMDSTFLGLIVGINKKLRKASGAEVVILHAEPACVELLKSIGVAKLVRLEDGGVEFPAAMQDLTGDVKATPEFILDAHENLSELSDVNRKRFAVLQDILKRQIDSGEDKS